MDAKQDRDAVQDASQAARQRDQIAVESWPTSSGSIVWSATVAYSPVGAGEDASLALNRLADRLYALASECHQRAKLMRQG